MTTKKLSAEDRHYIRHLYRNGDNWYDEDGNLQHLDMPVHELAKRFQVTEAEIVRALEKEGCIK